MKSATQRNAHDFYRTPAWCIEAIVSDLDYRPTLDPCAGDGAILDAVDAYHAKKILTPQLMRGIELHVETPEHLQGRIVRGDGLNVSWVRERVLMNPPFSNVEAWLEKAQEAKAAVVLMRLGVLAGQRRNKWWCANPPVAIRVLSKRPSFTGNGTDVHEYAWVAWGDIGAEQALGWLLPS